MFASFFFNHTATTEIYTLSLHDALPISAGCSLAMNASPFGFKRVGRNAPKVFRVPAPAKSVENVVPATRSEEHTSELQSRRDLVCRLLLEKKKHQSKMKNGSVSGRCHTF